MLFYVYQAHRPDALADPPAAPVEGEHIHRLLPLENARQCRAITEMV
jgi:hypothetical protein